MARRLVQLGILSEELLRLWVDCILPHSTSMENYTSFPQISVSFYKLKLESVESYVCENIS
jgi:hypothetical protein